MGRAWPRLPVSAAAGAGGARRGGRRDDHNQKHRRAQGESNGRRGQPQEPGVDHQLLPARERRRRDQCGQQCRRKERDHPLFSAVNI